MVPGLYDPFNFSAKRSEEAKARGREVEIKNGRLASKSSPVELTKERGTL